MNATIKVSQVYYSAREITCHFITMRGVLSTTKRRHLLLFTEKMRTFCPVVHLAQGAHFDRFHSLACHLQLSSDLHVRHGNVLDAVARVLAELVASHDDAPFLWRQIGVCPWLEQKVGVEIGRASC